MVLAARLTLGLPYRYSRMRGSERTRDGSREMAWTAGTRWPGRRGISSRIAIRVGGQLQGADKNQPEGSETSETSRGNASLVSFLTARLVSFLTARWAYTRWCGGGRCTVPNVHQTWTLQLGGPADARGRIAGRRRIRRPDDEAARSRVFRRGRAHPVRVAEIVARRLKKRAG